MREINFRGKGIDGEWVCGKYMRLDYPFGWHHHFILPIGTDVFPELFSDNDEETGRYLVEPVEVIPETIGQSTNLYDRNGVEIYEGDVVFDSQKKLEGYITFLLQEMGLVIVYEKFDSRLGHRNRGGGYDHDVTLEVIGNIHDQEEAHDENS